jgi:hypothetical protein
VKCTLCGKNKNKSDNYYCEQCIENIFQPLIQMALELNSFTRLVRGKLVMGNI